MNIDWNCLGGILMDAAKAVGFSLFFVLILAGWVWAAYRVLRFFGVNEDIAIPVSMFSIFLWLGVFLVYLEYQKLCQ